MRAHELLEGLRNRQYTLGHYPSAYEHALSALWNYAIPGIAKALTLPSRLVTPVNSDYRGAGGVKYLWNGEEIWFKLGPLRKNIDQDMFLHLAGTAIKHELEKNFSQAEIIEQKTENYSDKSGNDKILVFVKVKIKFNPRWIEYEKARYKSLGVNVDD